MNGKLSAAVCAALVLGLALCVSEAARAANEVTAVSVSGQVQFAKPGSSDWAPLEKGFKLSEGYSVRTDRDATAVLRWFDGNMIKISPLTAVAIRKMFKSGKTERSEIGLDRGRVFFKAKKLADAESAFEVRTPCAFAGVRGTEFEAEHVTDVRTTFTLIEGLLAVTAQEVTRMLTTDQMAVIESGKAPEEPVPASEEDLNRLRQESQELGAAAAAETQTGAAPPAEVDTAPAASDLAVQDFLQQDMDNLIMENIITPATGCCNY